ncbi:hypothetical protein F4604DRAFT_1933749 [Suillus subluteus]|nr:hypothetical protein F4604DRAFT_1933749 [Suillus subluteus]
MSVLTCPNCGKTFTKDSGVARHLSQPRTSCHSSIWDIVDISPFAEVEPLLHLTSPQADPEEQAGSMHDENDQVHINFDGDFNFIEDGFRVAEGSLEEWYEGAGMCYSEDGLIFLDVFDADEYADYRKDNLFYPFTSKEEWEISYFLLCSPLTTLENCEPMQRCFLADQAGSVRSSPRPILQNI